MGDKSAIEWTEATWNPLAGCSPVSEGCRNCYAARESIRLAGHPSRKVQVKYQEVAEMRGTGAARRAVFTGRINYALHALDQPLRWRKPRRVFVNSMSDLFHEAVPDSYIATCMAIMCGAPQHTYQVLTKRPRRMAELLSSPAWWEAVHVAGITRWWGDERPTPSDRHPPEHVWLGTSVEDQAAADERVPWLLKTPAAVRFLSCEPLLGSLDLRPWLGPHCRCSQTDPCDAWKTTGRCPRTPPRIGWVIVGGESGPGARPMHPDWARLIRDRCQAAGVPFFFKQWGAYAPSTRATQYPAGDGLYMRRVGKHEAGRVLDGREWAQYPEVAA